MKLATKGILVAAAGSIALASGAFGQDVETTKVAPLQQLLPNSYGKVEVRHELDVNMAKEKVTNQIPNLSVRPTLGSKFFDGDLNSSFTWIFQRNAGSTKVEKTTLYNVTTYNLISGTYGSITPYFETYQDNGDSFSSSYAGAEFASSKKVETGVGAVTFGAYSLPLWELTSGAGAPKVSPANNTGAATLTESEIEQRDPSIYSYTGAYTSFKPAAVAGLGLSLGTELNRNWKPKYETNLVDGGERTSLAGYATTNKITNKVKVSYPLSDKVTLSNEIRQYVGGAYEERIDGKRWENRLKLNATLF